MYSGIKFDYIEYMQMTLNCICLPLLKQLSEHHLSLIWERIKPFIYGSRKPISMILFLGEFPWIPHMLSIIDEETHNLQSILKTFCLVFFFQVYAVPSFTD